MTCHICVVSVSRWGDSYDMSYVWCLCLDGRTIVTCHICVMSVSRWEDSCDMSYMCGVCV